MTTAAAEWGCDVIDPTIGTTESGDGRASRTSDAADAGCFRYARLIGAIQLAVETLPDSQRGELTAEPANPRPSVITLNAIAVSHAMTH